MGHLHRRNDFLITQILEFLGSTLTLLILLIESALQSSQPRHSDQQPYELIENSFASNANSIPINNLDGIVTSITDGDTLVIRTNEGDVMTIHLH